MFNRHIYRIFTNYCNPLNTLFHLPNLLLLSSDSLNGLSSYNYTPYNKKDNNLKFASRDRMKKSSKKKTKIRNIRNRRKPRKWLSCLIRLSSRKKIADKARANLRKSTKCSLFDKNLFRWPSSKESCIYCLLQSFRWNRIFGLIENWHVT